jgi:hypothetical protein
MDCGLAALRRSGMTDELVSLLPLILALPAVALARAEVLNTSVVAARRSRPFSTAAGEKEQGSAPEGEFFISGGNLRAARRAFPPGSPRLLVRRAPARPRPRRLASRASFSRCEFPCRFPSRRGGGPVWAARAFGHRNRTVILSYADHGRSRAIAQERMLPPFCCRRKGRKERSSFWRRPLRLSSSAMSRRISGPRVMRMRKAGTAL